MKTGRNEPCPCGSGKKTKNCCQSAERTASKSRATGIIVAGIAVVAVIAAIAATRDDSAEAVPTSRTAAASLPTSAPAIPSVATPAAPVAQPSGPAPAGKVWSPQDGQWHDAPRSANEWVTITPKQSVPLNKSGNGLPVNIPQPAGPVPAGMVWSPEHGHWHDAKTGYAVQHDAPPEVASQMKQPGLPDSLKNYVWSEEHKHWHRKDANGEEHETVAIVPPGAGGTSHGTPAATPPPVNPK